VARLLRGLNKLLIAIMLIPVAWADPKRPIQSVDQWHSSALKDVCLLPEVKLFVERVLITSNHQHMPFLVVDKLCASVFVFDLNGKLLGAAPALIGTTVGDEAADGIGSRQLDSIGVEDRTTPSGRYLAYLGLNLLNEKILWVDYDTAISLHTVVTKVPGENRVERLTSITSSDNRISFGCINVSKSFFQKIVEPAFKKSNGIVYILPDSHAIEEVFGFFKN